MLSRSCVWEAGDHMTIPTGESKQIQVCVLITIIIADTPNLRRDSRSVELWNSCFPEAVHLHTPHVGPEPSFWTAEFDLLASQGQQHIAEDAWGSLPGW